MPSLIINTKLIQHLNHPIQQNKKIADTCGFIFHSADFKRNESVFDLRFVLVFFMTLDEIMKNDLLLI